MLFAWKGRYCTKTEQGSGDKPREQGRRNSEERRGCKEMLCVARAAQAKARGGHVAACAGSHEQTVCSKQAHTSLTSISRVPTTRPEPRGSREKYGLFPRCVHTTFHRPTHESRLVKIDSVLTVPVCTQTGRKKQPCWRDPTTTGFTTASPSTRAAKAHQPRCGSRTPRHAAPGQETNIYRCLSRASLSGYGEE